MSEFDKKLQDLKFAQASADGELKGHVSFMLICHRHGVVTDRQWDMLRHYHDACERANLAIANHVFQPLKVVQ